MERRGEEIPELAWGIGTDIGKDGGLEQAGGESCQGGGIGPRAVGALAEGLQE